VSLEILTGDLEIFADPWLKKAFFNLIGTTLWYKGTVTRITISSHITRDGLDLVFSDDGKGIAAGGKDTISRPSPGKENGYGLQMAREILAITGLTLQETSEPGPGARFTIAVPKRLYRIK
jgi:K+-sensing histidine kinase KdpD